MSLVKIIVITIIIILSILLFGRLLVRTAWNAFRLTLQVLPLTFIRFSLRFRARSVLLFIWLGLIIAFVSPGHLFAQQTQSDDEVLRVDTNLFVVPIRVRDKNKQTVASLTERDLTLKDDDHLTAGLYLKQGVDRVALVFALDQSGSTRDIISQQRKAALALFERFGERSQVAVIRFAETAEIVAPFGRDASVASGAFIFPAAADRHTAIFDAADAALKTLDFHPPGSV